MNQTLTVRALTSAMLLLFSTMLIGIAASPAHSAPGDPAPTAGLTMPWTALGLNSEIRLGPNVASSFSVPIPNGFAPQRLRGTIHTRLNMDGGSIEIDDGEGTYLATIDLPPANVPIVPFDVDISAANISSSAANLSFIVRPQGAYDPICGPREYVTLEDLNTVFTGADAPVTTVETFFSPVLQQVTVYAPVDANTAEQQAVLNLVSTLARVYRPQQLAISVVNQPRGAVPPPAASLARAIVVEEGDDFGQTVENPGSPEAYLRIAGKGDELSRQVSLLGNQLQDLVQAPQFRVEKAGPIPASNGDTHTFKQLKMTGEVDVLRDATLKVGVDRTRLGSGRISSVQVHLFASYTPVSKADTASVVIRSNGAIVYRALLDDTGSLDATFSIDSQTFGQWIYLDLAMIYTPQQTCGPLIVPITFQIDPRSTMTVTRGGAPLAGFSAVPSEFSPDFVVALDGNNPNQLSYAARVIAAIARLTSSPLTPKLVDVKTAAFSNSGALIVASSATVKQTSLTPPVAIDGTAVDVRLPSEFRGNMQGGLGSIQAFADRPRNRSVVLVTTTDNWSLVDQLLGYVEGLENGWNQLTGDVLVTSPGGTPSTLAIATEAREGVTVSQSNSTDESSDLPWIGIGAGVSLLAVGAAAVVLIRRRRGGA